MLEQANPIPPSSPSDHRADPSASVSPADLLQRIQQAGLPDNLITRLSVVMAAAAKELGPAISLKGLGIPLSLPIGSVLKPFMKKLLELPSDELEGQMGRLRELINFVCDAPRSAD